jgi:hypothetical protein
MNDALQNIGPWVNALGVPGVLTVALYALHKGWVVTGREYRRACEECEKIRREDFERHEQLRAERDEWKAAALRHLNVAERAVDTADRTSQRLARDGGR